ncbi:MAG: thiamine-phosphate kinase [Actinomycetota bacterium]
MAALYHSDVEGLVVGDLNEDDLLARFLPLLPPGSALLGPGDDAAVVPVRKGAVVATTDILVQDRDFRLDWSSAADVGWKAIMQNLADIAAMGAVPTAVLVGMILPARTPVSWVIQCAEGIAEACHVEHVGVVGGDLSSGEQIGLTVTALGEGEAPFLRRSTARVGDTVALAGTVGWSAAGLAVLNAGLDVTRASTNHTMVHRALQIHRRPQPPVRAGVRASHAGATSLMDVSDGLMKDLTRLARASAVDLELSGSALWECGGEELTQVALAVMNSTETQPSQAIHNVEHWLRTGGEDHSLVGTFPPEVSLPEEFSAIGRVVLASSRPKVSIDGCEASAEQGWDHFSNG